MAKVAIDFQQVGSETVVRAWEAQDQAIKDNTTELRAQAAENKRYVSEMKRRAQAQKENDAALKEAAAIAKSVQTPQQAYLDQVRVLRGHLEAGRLTTLQFTEAKKKLQQEYLKTTGAAQKRALSERTLAAATKEAAAITQRATTAQERFAQSMAELDQHLKAGRIEEKEYASEARLLKKALDDATGATALRNEEQQRAAAITQSVVTAEERIQAQLSQTERLYKTGAITGETYRRKLDALGKELRQATGEEQRHNAALAEAKRVVESTRTPVERYDREIQELTRHLQEGRINQETFNRAVKKADVDLAGATTRSEGMIGKLGGLALGLASVATATTALRAVLDTTAEFERSLDRTADRVDLAKLRLQLQGGIEDDAELQNLAVIVEKQLRITPSMSLEEGIAAQQQLISVGFDKESVDSGEALQSVLRMKAAGGQVGEGSGGIQQVRDDVRQMGAVLAASGKDKTVENLERLQGKFIELYANTPLETTDLPALVEATGSLASRNIEEDEILGAFSTGVGLLGGQKAATALDQISRGLLSSGDKSDKLRDEFGIDQTKFDLIGEGFAESLDSLTDQLKDLPLDKRQQALTTIFSAEAVKSFALFAENTKTIRDNTETSSRGGTAVERNARIFQASEFAAKERTTLDTEIAKLEIDTRRGGVSYEELRKILDASEATVRAAAGDGILSNTATSINTAGLRTSLTLNESLGRAPSEFLSELDSDLYQGGEVSRQFLERAKDRTEGRKGFESFSPELNVGGQILNGFSIEPRRQAAPQAAEQAEVNKKQPQAGQPDINVNVNLPDIAAENRVEVNNNRQTLTSTTEREVNNNREREVNNTTERETNNNREVSTETTDRTTERTVSESPRVSVTVTPDKAAADLARQQLAATSRQITVLEQIARNSQPQAPTFRTPQPGPQRDRTSALNARGAR